MAAILHLYPKSAHKRPPVQFPTKHPNLDTAQGWSTQTPLVPPFPIDEDPTKFLLVFREAVKSLKAEPPNGRAFRVFVCGKDSPRLVYAVEAVLSEAEDMAAKKIARPLVSYHFDKSDPPILMIMPF